MHLKGDLTVYSFYMKKNYQITWIFWVLKITCKQCDQNLYQNGTTFSDYAKFLMKKYIKPKFTRAAKGVHLTFDNPGRLKETPKHFERQRRDHTCKSIHVAQNFHHNGEGT